MEDREDLVKLPVLWSLVKISDIGYVKGGKRLPKGSQYSGIATNYPYIRVSDFKNGTVNLSDIRYICEEVHKKIAAYTISDKDIYISIAGTIGVVGRIPPELNGANLTENAAKIVLSTRIDADYIYQVLSSYEIQKKIHNKTIATTQPKLALFRIESLLIPLAPLNEQRRIVAKIEALKARSQRVKEELEDIPQLLDQFRQSVLAAAFRGDLTADWREQNSNVVKWETITLQEVIKGKPRNGYSPKSVDYPTKVKSITLTATTSGIFKPEYFKYIDEEISIDSYLWLSPGDILIQRSNTIEYVGTCAVYNGGFGEFIYPDLMMKIQVIEEKAIPEFIFYALANKATRLYFRKNATGTAGNMPKINQPIVMNTPVSLPSIEEQKEIVHQIKSLYKSVDIIKQQYQEIKADVDQLDQSILAKAFRGELVPQDPNDEPASVLLELIRAERAKLQTKTAKKSTLRLGSVTTTKTSARRTKKTQPQQEESVQLDLGLE